MRRPCISRDTPYLACCEACGYTGRMVLYRSRKRKKLAAEIRPDEIFVDSSNAAHFDRDRFEGRLEQPLSRRSFVVAEIILGLLVAVLVFRAGDLQIVHGATFATRAQENQLAQTTLFADRGVILDRTGIPLAYNQRQSVTDDFAKRMYADFRGLSHVVGYVQPPAKDDTGTYYRTAFVGLDGAEKAFNDQLAGQNGMQLTETDAQGKVVSQSAEQPPQQGQQVTLSIDANVTQALYDSIAAVAQKSHFQGGAGVIMDIKTGELLALTSYPDYPQQGLTDGDPAAIAAVNANPYQPFLDRATEGLYAPGSIVKPIVATAALTEGVIDENKQILSTGSISIPNPYNPTHPSVFLDWRANGWVDVRHALAFSSDVYFYEVGGGYNVPGQPVQQGLGIAKLDEYFKMFGFGQDPGLKGFTDASGNIPSPAWKAATFPSDPTWYLGDTYHTAIGQYGVQVSPLQAVREAAAIANGGTLLTPQLLASSTPEGTQLDVSSHALEVVREGMRLGVTDGISQSVKFDALHVAAKTGTAQVGVNNAYENSWMIGFFPYENPRWAYAVVLERTPTGTLMGSPAVMNKLFTWMMANTPQYLTSP
jgi:penicillin-binding protein 2